MNSLIVSLSCRFSPEILCLSSDHLIIKEARKPEPEETQICSNYVRVFNGTFAWSFVAVVVAVFLRVTQLCWMCWAGVIRMLSVSWLSLFPCYYSFRYPWSEKGSLTNLSGPSSLAVGYKAQRSCHHSLCPKGMGRTGREECQWDSWEGTRTPSANQRDAPHALSTLSFTGLFLETGTKREALAKILPLLKVISLILLN